MKFLTYSFMAFGVFAACEQSSFALPTCNINNANQTMCSNKKLYLCRLNGVGSTDPDSGKWIYRSACEETGADDSKMQDDEEKDVG